jgi:transposase-like protein
MTDINPDDYHCINKDCKFFNLPHSGTISIRARYGKNIENVLLYCRCCGKTFSSTHGTAYFRSRLPSNLINLIIQVSADGLGLNATCRLTGVSKTTVNEYIKKAAYQTERILNM